MAKGGGGPDSAGPGGMGADAFGGDRDGGGSSAGPSGRGGRSLGAIGASARSGASLSMDGRATPAEMDVMDIMDDVDRARAVRDALDAISAAQNQTRDIGRAQAVRDAQAAINQARDVARANAVREAQRNIAFAQAQQNALREAQAKGLIGQSIANPFGIDKNLRSIRETPVKTGMVMGAYKQDATPTALENKLGIPFGYSEFEGPALSSPTVEKGTFRDPPFATRSPTKAGLFGPSFEETKAINEAKKSANRNRVKEYAKSYKARIDDIDKQLKSLLDKGMANLFSKEYRELLDKKNNLMSHPNYNYVAHFDPKLKAAQILMGTIAPGPLSLGPILQDKAIDLGFIDDTPISEIENQDRQSVLEGDRGGNFYDYTFSAQ